MKIHARNTRLFVNAGMSFPDCYAGAKLLDLDKTHLPMSGIREEITCKKCRKKADAEYLRNLPSAMGEDAFVSWAHAEALFILSHESRRSYERSAEVFNAVRSKLRCFAGPNDSGGINVMVSDKVIYQAIKRIRAEEVQS